MGMAASKASVRSSTPPWPGNSVPLSFTPACRLSSDSKRSPTTETDASATTNTIQRRDRDPGQFEAEAGARKRKDTRIAA